MARRPSGIAGHSCCRAVRRDDWLRPLQSPGGKNLSRRCRQSADRPAAGLVPAATGMATAIRRRIAVAAVLFVGRHGDAVAPAVQTLTLLGDASLAFLSARDRLPLHAIAL